MEADAAALVAKWNLTSFFSLPPSKRWEVIKDVQHRYKELCVDDPKQRLEAHDEAAVERLQDNRRAEINKARDRFLNYKKLESIVPVTTEDELRQLFGSFDRADDSGRNNAMTDQIRVRIHIYGIKAKELPNMHQKASVTWPTPSASWRSFRSRSVLALSRRSQLRRARTQLARRMQHRRTRRRRSSITTGGESKGRGGRCSS